MKTFNEFLNRKIIMSNKKVFLGGTCNGSQWRETLIPMLSVKFFNPVVENWTPECQDEEIKQRQECDFCLYTITPKMTGVYSIAEVVDDSNKRPEKTVFVEIDQDGDEQFTPVQIKSMKMVKRMIEENGGKVCDSLTDAAEYLNNA